MELINYVFTQMIIWFTSRLSLSFLEDTLLWAAEERNDAYAVWAFPPVHYVFP